MVTEGGGLLALVLWPVFGLLVAGLVLAALRAMRGPTLPDRVVGLDTVTTLMIAFAAAFAIESGEAAFLDIAIALALVAFLTTVAFARYVERRGREGPGPGDVQDEA
jgi:multicomponent Na+:H+ antiporter subunit F